MAGIDPIQQFRDYHLGGRDFTWYLRYFGSARPTTWDVVLPTRAADPHPGYRVDVIDSWNMTITPVAGVFRMVQRDEYDAHDTARPTIALPGTPYTAIRVTRVDP